MPAAGLRWRLSIWEQVLDGLRGAAAAFSGLVAVGGAVRWTTVTLSRDRTTLLDLTALGVPSDAILHRITMTPQPVREEDAEPGEENSYLFPAVLMGGTLGVVRLPSHLTLAPVAQPPGSVGPRRQEVAAHVQYVTPHDEPAWQRLSKAFIAHGNADYASAVLDAHTAADLELDIVVSDWIAGLNSIPRQRTSFLLRIQFLAAVARLLGTFEPPAALIDGLKKLNSARNDVAHPRRRPSGLSELDSAIGLRSHFL